MPIPSPSKDEKQDAFIGRCISAVSKADPNKEQDQVVAMCYSAWRDAKKKAHKESPYGGDVTIDDRVGWLEDDLRSLWMRIDSINQRVDDIIAMGASMANARVVHLQAFMWQDGIISPCVCTGSPKFKSFKWVPELKMPDWATGRLYLFSTLESPKAADGKVFDDAQKNRCAATLIGASINIDHEKYDLAGQNVILDAEVEDARMEGLCYVEDPTLNKLYDDGEIAGCSIEWFDKPVLPNADGTVNVKGTKCIGLAFCTRSHLSKGYILGDPLSSVKAMSVEIAALKLTVGKLTVALDELTAVPVVPIEPVVPVVPVEPVAPVAPQLPDSAFAFVGDEERKLQMKTIEGVYDGALLKAAVAEMAGLLPPAAVPGAQAKLREGFVALGLPVPEEIAEVTKPLIAALDPKITRKLQHSLDRRERYKERFRIWNGEELE